MVTEEEMMLRKMFEKHAASPKDLQHLYNLGPVLQGTNFESYPERFIPPHSSIYVGDPYTDAQRFKDAGLTDKGIAQFRDPQVWGVAPRTLPRAFIKPKGTPSEIADTVAHELEHTSQWRPPVREGWGQLKTPQEFYLASNVGQDITKTNGSQVPNTGELMANLSGLEALAPVGDSWKTRMNWSKNITDEGFKNLDARRRPDLKQPLPPLPRPEVKQWGYTGNHGLDLLERLYRYLGMRKK